MSDDDNEECIYSYTCFAENDPRVIMIENMFYSKKWDVHDELKQLTTVKISELILAALLKMQDRDKKMFQGGSPELTELNNLSVYIKNTILYTGEIHVKVSKELADFLSLPPDAIHPRTLIYNQLVRYMMESGCSKRRYYSIFPNTPLIQLLRLEPGDVLTHFNLWDKLNIHLTSPV
jgi:hypothetical protein